MKKNQIRLMLTCTILLGLISCGGKSKEEFSDIGVGGDFTLRSFEIPEWKFSDQKKKWNLLFFGYTACPDYCPMTLSKLKKVNESLKEKSKTYQILFVNLDSSQNDPEKIQSYLNFYVPNGVGLTGSESEIQSIAKLYAASFAKNGKLIDHSTYIYLIDENLKTRYLFRYGDSPEEIEKILRLVLEP
jgi:protein SCO1/2